MDTEELKHFEHNRSIWDQWASSMDSGGFRYKYLRKCQQGVISLLSLKEDISVLDIGCGTGYALGEIAKKAGNRGTFYGVDLSAKMIERANEKFRDSEQFHFMVSNAESIPLEDNLFDIIICINSFHHYYHPEKAIAEMHRLLKDKGKVYILDPTLDGFIFRAIDKLVRIFHQNHEKLHSSKEFKELMKNSGLNFIERRKIQIFQKIHIGQK